VTVTLVDPRIRRVIRRRDSATVNHASTDDDVKGAYHSNSDPHLSPVVIIGILMLKQVSTYVCVCACMYAFTFM